METQKGFSAIEGLLVLIIIGILGFTGWYVWNSRNSANKNLDNANSLQFSAATKRLETTDSNLRKYSNTAGGFTLEYPAAWTAASDGTSLDSPSGNRVNIVVITEGGRDFCDGGGCPSLEYNSVEAIGQQAVTTSDSGSGVQVTKVPLNLVTLTESDGSKNTYYIGLSSRSDAKANINKTQAGIGAGLGDFLFSAASSKDGFPLIAIYSSSTDSKFLASSDAVTIKSILKSFKYSG